MADDKDLKQILEQQKATVTAKTERAGVIQERKSRPQGIRGATPEIFAALQEYNTPPTRPAPAAPKSKQEPAATMGSTWQHPQGASKAPSSAPMLGTLRKAAEPPRPPARSEAKPLSAPLVPPRTDLENNKLDLTTAVNTLAELATEIEKMEISSERSSRSSRRESITDSPGSQPPTQSNPANRAPVGQAALLDAIKNPKKLRKVEKSSSNITLPNETQQEENKGKKSGKETVLAGFREMFQNGALVPHSKPDISVNPKRISKESQVEAPSASTIDRTKINPAAAAVVGMRQKAGESQNLDWGDDDGSRSRAGSHAAKEKARQARKSQDISGPGRK
jgi:hypothetical protein